MPGKKTGRFAEGIPSCWQSRKGMESDVTFARTSISAV